MLAATVQRPVDESASRWRGIALATTLAVGILLTGVRAGAAGNEVTLGLPALRRRAGVLVRKRDRWLLSKEIQRSLAEAITDKRFAVGIARAHAALAGAPHRPDDKNVLALRLPSKQELFLRNVGRRLEHLALQRGQEATVAQFKRWRDRNKGKILLKAYHDLTRAETEEKQKQVLEALPQRVRAAAQLSVAPEGWSDGDGRELDDVIQDAQAVVAKASEERDPAVFDALALVIDLQRVSGYDEPLLESIRMLATRAAELCPRPDQAAWQICRVADVHFGKHRYALAMLIYRRAYELPRALKASSRPPEVGKDTPATKARGEQPASQAVTRDWAPSVIYAGLRIVRCDWELGRLARTAVLNRKTTLTVLREMKDKLVWAPRLEGEYIHVMRHLERREPQFLDELPPYFWMLIQNASEKEVASESGMVLMRMLASGGRWEEALAVAESTKEVAPDPQLRQWCTKRVEMFRRKIEEADKQGEEK